MPSTVIRRFAYDPVERTLDVTFVSGLRYRYHDVPEEVHERMQRAFAKGRFFNTQIRDHFRHTRVGARDSSHAATTHVRHTPRGDRAKILVNSHPAARIVRYIGQTVRPSSRDTGARSSRAPSCAPTRRS